MPTDSSANGASRFATKSGAHTASLLTRTITSAAPASAAPRFTARPKPRFSAFRTTVTCGKRAASISSRPVARRVVDDDDLDRDGLGFDARDRLGEQFAGVQRRDDDDGPHATRHDTRMLRVVMWSTDPVGKQMAGPGIRYHRLATELAQRFEVTLVAPGEGIPEAPYTFRPAESVSSAARPGGGRRRRAEPATRPDPEPAPGGRQDRLRPVCARTRRSRRQPRGAADRRSVRRHPLRGGRRRHARLAPARRRLPLRQRTAARSLVGSARRSGSRLAGASMHATRRCGRSSPSSRSGSTRHRRASGRAVKGVLPGIGPADRLLLWGGGIWNWFDPLTVIRAVGRLSEGRSDVKLLFLGLKHPSSAVAEMTMADQAVALAARARARWDARSSSTVTGFRTTSVSRGSPRRTSA